MLIKSINASYDNQNGLASFKFGSVASFLTLSLLERNFPEGLEGVCQTVENPEGWGGGYSLLQKMENPGRGGVLSEIPSVVGVWIFSGITQ